MNLKNRKIKNHPPSPINLGLNNPLTLGERVFIQPIIGLVKRTEMFGQTHPLDGIK